MQPDTACSQTRRLKGGMRHDLDFAQHRGPDLFHSGHPVHSSVGIYSGVRRGPISRMEIAEALGLDVPAALLARADEVIE